MYGHVIDNIQPAEVETIITGAVEFSNGSGPDGHFILERFRCTRRFLIDLQELRSTVTSWVSRFSKSLAQFLD